MAYMTTSDMYCTKCGQKNIPIPLSKGKEREGGHLKKMYCIHCKQTVNMVEIRGFSSSYNLDDFLLEYELHNFTEEGTRKLSINEFRVHVNNGGGVLD